MTPAELRQTRAALGLTQRGLAERLAIPQATVWRWETAKTKIQHPRMLALALWALAAQELQAARAARLALERLSQGTAPPA